MKKNTIIETLSNAGYSVTEVNTVKNGTLKNGLSISNGTKLAVVIYTDHYESIEDEAELFRILDEAFENARENNLAESVNELTDLKNIEDSIYIGIEPLRNGRIYNDDSVYRTDLQKKVVFFLYTPINVKANGNASVRITKHMIAEWETNEDTVWEIAEKNTRRAAEIKTMFEKLFEIGGIPEEVKESMQESTDMAMYVVTNKDNFRGSGILYSKEYFSNICTLKGWKKITIIPSSIHELLIIPYEENTLKVNQVIQEINDTVLEENDFLADNCFVFDNNTQNFEMNSDCPF